MRLIDADALESKMIKEKDAVVSRDTYGIGYNDGMAMAYALAVMSPTIDAVEVVRCKDCKWWGGKYSSNECSKITTLSNPDCWLKTLPEDFCSSGERRDDNA